MKRLSTFASIAMLLTVVGCANRKAAPEATASNSLTDVTPVTAPNTAYKPEPVTTVTPAQPVVTDVATTSTPTGPAFGSNSTHVVKKGETLYSLARQHYGDGKQWQKIAMANPGISPSSLKVGQTIVIP